MPVPTRSRSLRQPGFSQTQFSGVKGAPDKAADASGNGDGAFGRSRNLQNNAGCHVDIASKIAHSAAMAPPSQLKRASSLRKPSRQSVVPTLGTTHPLRNASSANVPPTQTVSGSLSLPQPDPNGIPSGTQTPQSTDQMVLTRSSTVQSLSKPHLSLHSRSQSAGGSTIPQVHRQVQTAAHTREISASSPGMLLSPRLEASSQGRDISNTVQVIAEKPHFSTYQQHFSPRRTSKLSAPIHSRRIDQQQVSNTISAATTTYAGPGDDSAASQAQISRLQDELLQVQLLHHLSHSQQKNYLENTIQKLKARFTALSRDHRALAAQEYAYNKELNCVALQQWLDEGELSSLGKMQTLARCIQDVATLTALDGMLCMATEQFESWFERAILISDSRSTSTAPLQHHDIFVGPLDQEWHDIVTVLLRKLGGCAAILEALGPAKENSSLAMVLGTHQRFVDNLRQELEYSSAIEKIFLQREQVWIDESIASIMQENDPVPAEGQQDDHRHRRRGPWNVDVT